jgi:hypothetical protein
MNWPPITTSNGEDLEFRYYFCQREAIETLIYLKEVPNHLRAGGGGAIGPERVDAVVVEMGRCVFQSCTGQASARTTIQPNYKYSPFK